MSIVAEQFDVVIGVDTHTDTHAAAVLNRIGAVLAQTGVTTDSDGMAGLMLWARGIGPGKRLWVLEGTRSHGQGLTRMLQAAGEQVRQAPPPEKKNRRRSGKSDSRDAVTIATRALAILGTPAGRLADPRTDGIREALRIALTCRRHYTDTRTATVNLFKSLILTADQATRDLLAGRTTTAQARLATTLSTPGTDPDTAVRHAHLATLAADILAADRRINTNLRQLRDLVGQLCPALLDQPGVGPVTGATLLIAWSHKGRFPHEAAFAKLAGASPVEASSGRITRHRLNRGGDRTLNSALHTITRSRCRCHQPTRDYLQRRTTEGKTTREILRCLKRYTARQLFRIMENNTITT